MKPVLRLRADRADRAFTLIEIVLVLVILGLLSGAAALKLVPMLRTATLEDAVRRVEEVDRLARRRAVVGALATRITFKLDEGCVFYTEVAAAMGPQSSEKHDLQRFPRCRIVSVRVGDRKSTRDTSASGGGEMTVDCSAAGLTPSYALELADEDGRRQWVLMAGLSGNCEVFNGADASKKVEAVFAAIARETAADGDDTR